MFKDWLRNYLGITDLTKSIQEISTRQYFIGKEVNTIKLQSIAANQGMARIIIKLDPLYGIDEQDPDRVAASRKLEEQVINRLYAEHRAANHHKGES